MFHVKTAYGLSRHPRHVKTFDSLESALDKAFSLIGVMYWRNSVWIETETGEKLALMN